MDRRGEKSSPPSGSVERSGEPALAELVERELRSLAAAYLRRERSGHTLQATALAHEAWLRLSTRPDVPWSDRESFLPVAARAIRRILVDHARKKRAAKRGGAGERVELETIVAGGEPQDPLDVLALEEALGKLEVQAPRQARVVELRFFGGLDVDETARVLGVSPRTVALDWAVARLFLRAELAQGGPAA